MPTGRTVLLPSPRAFCAGVERAISVVEELLDQHGRVHVRRQIVHNQQVIAGLEARGAVFVDELAEVPDGAVVVFSAHGVSPAVRHEAAGRALPVVDATCPLVARVHARAVDGVGRGDTMILIGHAGHEEVEGVMGEAPGRIVLVETVDDVERLRVPDPARVAYLTQTTLSVRETARIVAALRARFPLLRGPATDDDICYATTNRQNALIAVLAEADLVLVVGSANSSNARRLVETAHEHGVPAHLIDGPGRIDPAWLDGVEVIGLTAGASAPPGTVDEVLTRLAAHGPLTVEERVLTRETTRFRPVREGSAHG
ncbi:4-hydroxy-3-methylbut-2-enyl diphosphate reductase [Kineosporia sp. J2-2]|uniref:4-hydroxy-3-methylbut-2-enyl diphosphate reductase n=1 Tax=Kineosporia corallincola TaxID=2835133 RepID=A0ABS5TLK4_9ACTN|nr:4-hydroxy-3-methylbut-2-enyl diphosphate reductase [Kineosporia corallincola]MBT0771966.1 4-hydroxy-3-methylbut-2-enyl diphosphate reductase [Kineosporia corallincola]